MLIAVPSDSTDGLDAAISEHFGHCAAFTIITVKDDSIGDVSIVENTEHEQGGCMAPVNLLKKHGVEVLLAGGMGMQPLAGFQQVGIDVHHKKSAGTVREAIELFLIGGCPAFGEAQTCSGGEGGCGGHNHHHHHEPQTIPIDGPADIREGRMVILDYEVKDSSGNPIDDSVTAGPMRFIFGSGQMLPAIEQSVAGLEPGASITKEVQSKDAFGDRDESRVIEAPREQLPPNIAVGAVVTARDPQGQQFPMTVIHLDDGTARLDGNHPLAGKDLVFCLTVKSVEGVKTSQSGFTKWNCYKGDLEVLKATGIYTQLPGSIPLARRDCKLRDPWVDDATPPASGQVAYFLTTGVSGSNESDLGQDSAGNTRPNENPCP